MPANKSQVRFLITCLAVAWGFFATVGQVNAQWSGPTQEPPLGNPSPFVSTDATSQTKTGTLTIGTNFYVNGSSAILGSLGLNATPTSTVRLLVAPIGNSSIDAGTGAVRSSYTALADNDLVNKVYLNASLSTLNYWIKSGSNLYSTSTITNVGIGTNSPNSNLEVVTSTNPTISISSTGGATSNHLNFRANSHSQPVQAQIKTVDNGDFSADLVFSNKLATSGGALTERMRIKSNGNVGIGTNNPQRALDLGSAGKSIAFGNDVTQNAERGIYWHSNSAYGIYETGGTWTAPTYQQLKFAWDTGIIIDGGSAYGKSGTVIQPNSGNVGIGTTSPIHKLDVYGGDVAIRSSNALKLYGPNNGSWNTLTTNASYALQFTAGAVNSSDIVFQAPRNISFQTGLSGYTEKVVIKQDGNVGIGTTNPGSYKLNVDGSLNVSSSANFVGQVTVPTPTATSSAVNKSYVDGIALTAQNALWNLNGSSLRPSSTAWNVAIGTTSTPSAKLEVAGSFRVSGAASSVRLDKLAGTGGRIVMTDAEGNLYATSTSIATGIAVGASGQTLRHDGTSWVANSLLYNNGTNVGIGTTNTGAKLDVLGTNSAMNFRVASPSGQIQMYNWSDNRNYIESTNASGTASQLLYFTGYGGGAGTFAFNGNVGIASTSPAAQLGVNGTGYFTGTVSVATPTADSHAVNRGYLTSALSAFNTSTNLWASSAAGTYNVGLGNVLIGTTTMTSGKLNINGDVSATGNYKVGANNVITSGRLIMAANGTASAPAHSFSSDTNTGMYRGGTDILRFSTAGADRMTILANGNVGIGTTSPNSSGGYNKFVHIQGGYASLILDSTTSAKKYEIGSSGAGGLDFYDGTAGAVRMTINTTGGGSFVGQFAVPTPTAVSSAATKGYVDDAFTAYNNSSNYWKLSSNNLYVSSTAWRVGIGTTSPDKKLVVQMDDAAGTDEFKLVDSNGASVFTIDSDGNTWWNSNMPTVNFNNANTTGINNITISDGGPQEGMTWADSTWSIDTSPLDRSNATGNLNFYNTANNIAFWRPSLWVYNSSTYTTATAQSNGGLNFTTTGSGNITFNPGASGGVGIGTTNPDGHKLYVDNGSAVFTGQVTVPTPIATSSAVNRSYVDTNFAPIGGTASLWATSSNGTYNTGLGNVMVGTTTMASGKLNVNGSVSISGSYRVGSTDVITSGRLIRTANGTVGAPAYSFSNSTNTGMYSGGAGNLRLVTGGVDRITVNSFGNVGVGTNAPQSGMKMDVRSDTGDNNSAITAYGYSGNGGRAIHAYGYATAGTGINYGIMAESGGTRAAGTNIGGYFSAAGALYNYALITGSGNVGIGSSTPGYKMSVNGTGHFTGTVVVAPPTADSHAVNLGYLTSTLSAFNTSTNLWRLNGDYLYPSSTAWKVGIGTSTPSEMLEVVGKMKIGNNTVSGENVTFDGSTAAGMRLQNAYGYINLTPLNGGWAHIYTDRNNFIFNKPVYSGANIFSSYDGDLQLRRIGTTKINAGSTTVTIADSLTVNGTANSHFNGTVSVAPPLNDEDAVNKGYLLSSLTNDSFWKLSGNNLYASSTAWNVGVGVTAPGTYDGVVSKIEAKGTGITGITINSAASSTASLVLAENNDSMWHLLSRGDQSNRFELYAADGTSDGAKLTVLQGGNTGIGTVSPNEKLSLYTASAAQTAIKFGNSTTGDAATDGLTAGIESNGSAFLWQRENNYLRFGTNNTERMRIAANGKVGIGTVSPAGRLDLGASVGGGNGLRIGDYLELNERENFNNGSTIGFNAYIDPTNINNFKPTYAVGSGMVLAEAGGGSGNLDFYGINWNNATSSPLTSFNHVMRLSVDGKIGIRTDNPTSSLDVYGGNVLINDAVITSSTPKAAINKEYLDSALTAFNTNTNLWKLSGSNLYASSTAWNVGIGTSSMTGGKLNVNGDVNVSSGFKINNAATSGNYLRGNGARFVASTILDQDLSSNIYNLGQTYGYHDYGYSIGEGWKTISSLILNSNCQSTRLFGDYQDLGYNSAARYTFNITGRAECDFTTNNESHNVKMVYQVNSNNNLNFDNKIRLVRTNNATNAVTYELQVYVTTWDVGSWVFRKMGNWTVYNGPQTAGAPLADSKVIKSSYLNVNDGRISAGGISIGTTTTGYGLAVGSTGAFGSTVFVAPPTDPGHAATKGYVDSMVTGSFWRQSGNNLYASSTAWNVGIGTNSPFMGKLHINASGASTTLAAIPTADQVNIAYGYNGANSWIFREAYASSNWGLFHNNDNNAFDFVGGGVSSLHLSLNTGNIGIGNTNPNARLEVSQPGSDTLTSRNHFIFSGANGTNNYFQLGLDSSGNLMVDNLKGTSANVMTLQNSGNIGIASTSPNYKLTVEGTGYFYNPVIVGSPSADNHAATKNYVDSMVTGSYWRQSGSNLYASSTAWNVGIGTNSPGSKLTLSGGDFEIDNNKSIKVSSASVNTTLLLGNYLGTTTAFTYGSSVNNRVASLAVEGDVKADRLCIEEDCKAAWSEVVAAGGGNQWITSGNNIYNSNSGNVGIGVTGPSAALDIFDMIKLTAGGGIYSQDNSNYLDLSNTLSDALKVSKNIYSTKGVLKTDGDGDNYMIGNLGLGVTSPAAKLQVDGGLVLKRTAIGDTNYTALSTDYIIAFTNLSAQRTLTLPTALCDSTNAGRVFVVVNETSSNYSVSIDPEGSATIAGFATIELPKYNSTPVYCNGSGNWFIY